jgi:Ni/Co efflux regulator RcnB
MHYIGGMIRIALFATACLCATPAWAQLEPLPRFEALEKQFEMATERQFDRLEAARQREMNSSALPGSGVSEAERGLRGLEYQRQREALLLQLEQDRALVKRERDLAEVALLNARVPAFSSVVVREPNAYLLPPAPPGKYYARVQGRFVIVDATSELVESVLPVQPTDPTADVPLGPRALPDMGLRVRRVSAASALVIRNPALLSLPGAPAGQYYARVEGKIVLVDARTEMPVKVVRAG